MNKHIVLCMTLTAAAAFAQSPKTTPQVVAAAAKGGSGNQDVQSHSSEPIIIGDGSVKLSFYGGVSIDKQDPSGRTLSADAGLNNHKGTFSVATGVTLNGLVKTASGGHPSAKILSYRYEIEAWDVQQHKWLPYAFIDFVHDPVSDHWKIFPFPKTALDLVQDGNAVTSPPGYPNHVLTKYEYRKGERRLRVGWLWVNGENSSWQFQLATGCSAYRIEPDDHPLDSSHHPDHKLPPLDNPCLTKHVATGKTFQSVDVGPGIKGIDVSDFIIK